MRQYRLIDLDEIVMHGLGLFKVLLNQKCLFDVIIIAVGKSDQEILGSNPTFAEISNFFYFVQSVE